MRGGGRVFAGVAMLIQAGAIGACSTSMGATTKMTLDDVNDMTQEMGVSLRSSNFLRDRTSESPRVLVAVDRAQNLTRDVIPLGEQWMIMQRIKDSAALQQIGREFAKRVEIEVVVKTTGRQRAGLNLAAVVGIFSPVGVTGIRAAVGIARSAFSYAATVHPVRRDRTTSVRVAARRAASAAVRRSRRDGPTPVAPFAGRPAVTNRIKRIALRDQGATTGRHQYQGR